ncbi:MAG: hypothetical protein G01um101433_658 [Parcubacteria group bacterium Gr01-1014_33]|nr:MAG: hypothetical protein G01um101433_658 [Parcubacteria group bacterium Gr01-1014_33]
MNTIEKSNTLGSRLRARREELGLSIQDIAREIKISSQYISALEEGNFGFIGARVYARGFLKKMLHLLVVENGEEWFSQFEVEWDIWIKKRDRTSPIPGSKKTPRMYLTSRRFFLMLGGAVLAAFLIFAGMQIKNFVGRPALVINEPRDRSELDRPIVVVKGKTEKESRLTVNGREITIDGSGNFQEEIELANGVNSLEFLAQNRFGKETKEVRHVVVK